LNNIEFIDELRRQVTSFDFVADNPGKWLYHCHVTDHMMGGMVGLYVINDAN
jgi:FtsP/CotA-like multicopper oxidase with cupredoxin domain